MANIAVIGTNYVGLVTAACFAELGNQVVGIDIDPGKVERLGRGQLPIYEPGLEEIVVQNLKAGRLKFTLDYDEGLKSAQFAFVCVGTPSGIEGEADLSQVRAATHSLAQHTPSEHSLIVVNKSTMPVGTGDWMPPALERVTHLYRDLQPEPPIIKTDINSSEMIKYASNAFLATKISFINEIASICERLGADVKEVARGMGLDRRISPEFLDAGVGYGGSCFPKDVKALAHMASMAGAHPQLLRAVMEINRDMRRLVLQKVRGALGTVEERTIGVLGLAFKPNTDDLRESPAVEIIHLLKSEGARVKAYDPAANEAARSILPGVELCKDAYEVAKGADALILLTQWSEFRRLDLERIRRSMAYPLMVDGRNLYDPAEMVAKGFFYQPIGRSAQEPGVPEAPRPARRAEPALAHK